MRLPPYVLTHKAHPLCLWLVATDRFMHLPSFSTGDDHEDFFQGRSIGACAKKSPHSAAPPPPSLDTHVIITGTFVQREGPSILLKSLCFLLVLASWWLDMASMGPVVAATRCGWISWPVQPNVGVMELMSARMRGKTTWSACTMQN